MKLCEWQKISTNKSNEPGISSHAATVDRRTGRLAEVVNCGVLQTKTDVARPACRRPAAALSCSEYEAQTNLSKAVRRSSRLHRLLPLRRRFLSEQPIGEG